MNLRTPLLVLTLLSGCSRRTANSHSIEASPPSEAAEASTAPAQEGFVPVDGAPLFVDPTAWLTERGVDAKQASKASLTSGSCRSILIGASNETALSCQEVEHVFGSRKVSRMVVRERTRVVRSNNPVVVLDVPIAIDPLEGPDQLLALEVAFAPDGNSATVQDRAETPELVHCKGALLALSERGRERPDPKTMASEYDTLDKQLIKRLCDGSRRFVWKDSRFVPAPP
ncbi:MAG: hypothetical protein FWD69_08520 [Polyangiaceae bacterium]|nr:hypothetical protein [Polyangiaceae bacterium]